jgi:hypothetical protein
VNLSDFNRLAANFGQNGRRWSHGDFTYNGLVNLDDFNRLAVNFGLPASPGAASHGGSSVQSTADDEDEVLA